jgi:hypothetical protein
LPAVSSGFSLAVSGGARLLLTDENENHIHFHMEHGRSRCSGQGGSPESPREVIARGSFALAERCRCGVVYLTVGPVSLRLDPNALPELAQVVRQAFEVLLTMESPEPGEVAGERTGEGEEPGGDRGSEQSPPNKLN